MFHTSREFVFVAFIFLFFFKRATGESGTGSGSLRGVGGKDLRERWFQDGLFWLDARSMPLDVRESRKRPQSADCCPTISNGTFFVFVFLILFSFFSFPRRYYCESKPL
jgi:hypothetical protein